MLSINPSETIWAILSFFALLFILKHFLYEPVLRFMDERRARIDAGLGEEKQAEDALEEDARKMEQLRQDGLQMARQLLREEKSRDEERRSEAVREAREAAAALTGQGRDEAQALREETARALARRRDELADYLAGYLLRAGNTEQ